MPDKPTHEPPICKCGTVIDDPADAWPGDGDDVICTDCWEAKCSDAWWAALAQLAGYEPST